MAVTVKLKYLRISARKVRVVADMIRKKRAEEALRILEFTVKRAAEPMKKLLNSALAAAENDFGLERPNLYISKLTVDEGPTLKRTRARARGRFLPIMKRTSHITLTLDEIEKATEKKEKKVKRVKKVKKEPVKKVKKEAVKKVKKEDTPKAKKPGRRPQDIKGTRTRIRPLKRVFRRKAF
jgi:large subunit ribosomal protein L22